MSNKWIAKGTSIVQEHKDGWALIAKTVDAGINEARLIAAAPEMLEALKLLQSALTEYKLRDVKKRFSICLADSAASKAIAKAEGL